MGSGNTSSGKGIEEGSVHGVKTMVSGSDCQGMERNDHGEEKRYPVRHKSSKGIPRSHIILGIN